ncbi:chaplin [Streptomyces sp. NBC_01352]|uniref:chaplin n=1 Tax=Streptomyces sp. NBC_01352 TaxID=2903834 RepID=UPI002E319880|nr:chaplin [Streptomyces sp. NBC_01352]
MRRVTRNGVIAVAAASGAMAVAMPAYADSGANGAAAGSPGVISGNTVQLPVHVPVNVCGNTVNVVGLLNPAAGNSCADEDAGGDVGADAGGDAAGTSGGATANSGGKDSPGVLSGNGVQLPVHLPVNVSGNSVNVVGVGNPAVGNESVNTSGDGPERPDRPEQPAPRPTEPPRADPGREAAPPAPRPHFTAGQLADTGTDRTLPAVLGSAALVLGGAAVHRRFRPRATR